MDRLARSRVWAVVGPSDDRIVGVWPREKVWRLVRANQAYIEPGGLIRLRGHCDDRRMRTRTGSGSVLGGQVYTTNGDTGMVDGYKTIYAEDRYMFIASVTGEFV